MADWSLPVLTTNYVQCMDDFKNRDSDAACLAEAPTTPPVGYIRYNRTLNKFQEWDGAVWVDKVLSAAGGGSGTTNPFGTMAFQNSNAVNITGGNITVSSVRTTTLVANSIHSNAGYSAGPEGSPILVIDSSGNISEARITDGTLLARVAGNETITGSWTFSGIIPKILFCETDAATNTKYWKLYADQGIFRIGSVDDSASGGGDALKISRSGDQPTQVEINTHGRVTGNLTVLGHFNVGATTTLNSLTVTGITTADSRVVITANAGSPTSYYCLELRGGAALGGDHPGIIWHSTNQAANAKKWRVYTYGGNFEISRLTDAEDAAFATTKFYPDGRIDTPGDFITKGAIYPGRIDTPGIQLGWYLASHGSYGLYSNTGLYLASGNLWVNNSVNIGNTLTVTSGINANGGVASTGYRCRSGINGAYGGNWFNFQWTGAFKCYVDDSFIGDIAFTSDARLKRDFTPLVNSLEKVLQMRPGTFYYQQVGEDAPIDPDLHLGLLAQDVQPIAPEIVRNTGMVTPLTPDGVLQVSYVEMVPMLVAAIQELEQRVAALDK